MTQKWEDTKVGYFQFKFWVENVLKKGDLQILLHVRLIFYKLNKYAFFYKKSLYKNLARPSKI